MNIEKQNHELRECLRWALQWIDEVPDDVDLPTMPGFDRDYVNDLLATPASPASAQPVSQERPDQNEFERQAAYQGARNFTLALGMKCANGWFPATYACPETELAWRVWANRNIAPASATVSKLVATVKHSKYGNRIEWISDEAMESVPDGAALYTGAPAPVVWPVSQPVVARASYLSPIALTAAENSPGLWFDEHGTYYRPSIGPVEEMVNRFLCWPLPASITTSGIENPIGTHLMSAADAKAMFYHCLATTAAPAKAEPVVAVPVAYVIFDADGWVQFSTKYAHEAQEHINDAVMQGDIDGAGKWKAVPVFDHRPTDDALWDQTLRQRDAYHDYADHLAGAIAKYFGDEIGEHSSNNCPWDNAIEIIESATPLAAPVEQDKPTISSATGLDQATVDKHLDAVLRASGSALKYFSMQKTIDGMRSAMRAALNGEAAS